MLTSLLSLLLPLTSALPPAALGEHAMVVTTEPHATQVGVDVLKGGGNAVDAAVAVAYALAVTFPEAGNLGGGGFMVVRAADGETAAFDFREKAPLKAHRGMYQNRADDSLVGYRAAGVPGTVAGLSMALQAFGTKRLSDLIEPARRMAADGFVVPEGLYRSIERQASKLAQFPDTAKVFLPGGKPVATGQRLRQPDLADTLAQIQQGGPAAFYEGPIAQQMAKTIQERGGLISLDDLRRYRAVRREPILGLYRGVEYLSMPPPSSGGTTLAEILNILEHYPISQWGPTSPQTVHVMAEAMRRSYDDRNRFLGDPDFVAIPNDLTRKPYATRLAKTISLFKATPTTAWEGQRLAESNETTHFSIADKAGNMVACTITLNGSYGSKAMTAGFLLNNEMDDFMTQPGKPNLYGLIQGETNRIEPGKRMLSSMTPTVVTRDGKPLLVIGSPGGSTIITTVLQVLLNVVDHRMPLAQAVSAPRIHHQGWPDQIFYEKNSLPITTIQALQSLGHQLVERDGPQGIVQAIQYLPDGRLEGVTDPRGYGQALGW